MKGEIFLGQKKAVQWGFNWKLVVLQVKTDERGKNARKIWTIVGDGL